MGKAEWFLYKAGRLLDLVVIVPAFYTREMVLAYIGSKQLADDAAFYGYRIGASREE